MRCPSPKGPGDCARTESTANISNRCYSGSPLFWSNLLKQKILDLFCLRESNLEKQLLSRKGEQIMLSTVQAVST